MVFENLGDTVRDLLGREEQDQAGKRETQDMVDEEFAEIYSNQIVSALENQDYGRAEELVEPTGREFGDLMEEYIEDRLNSGVAIMEYFDERTDKTEEIVEKASRQIRKVKNRGNRTGTEKMAAKPVLSTAETYVSQVNSDSATRAMREGFKAFHMAGRAADYVRKRSDIELEQYKSEQVKLVAGKKASEMRQLDRKMGTDFMVPKYNKLVEEYNNL